MFTIITSLMLSAMLFIVLLICKLCGVAISWWLVFILPPFLALGTMLLTLAPFVLLMFLLGSIAQ